MRGRGHSDAAARRRHLSAACPKLRCLRLNSDALVAATLACAGAPAGSSCLHTQLEPCLLAPQTKRRHAATTRGGACFPNVANKGRVPPLFDGVVAERRSRWRGALLHLPANRCSGGPLFRYALPGQLPLRCDMLRLPPSLPGTIGDLIIGDCPRYPSCVSGAGRFPPRACEESRLCNSPLAG